MYRINTMETIISYNLSIKNPIKEDYNAENSLAKSENNTIDLFELVKQNSGYARSHISTQDSISTRTEDDTSRSVISEVPSALYRSTSDTFPLDHKMTLKEIISKRCHQKRQPKALKEFLEAEQRSVKNSKRKAESESLSEEETIKKHEKLNDGAAIVPQTSTEQKIEAPKLVLKDGKVKLEVPSFEAETKEQGPIEVFQDKKKFTTSNSFKNINHSEKWTEDETEKFFRALEIFGTDFSLIAKLFPNRNRNQIKNKFLKEERVSKEKVDAIFKGSSSKKLNKIYKNANTLIQATRPAIGSDTSIIANITLDKSKVITKIRSDSFNSTSSIDSLDRSIIDDISKMLK